MSLFDMSAINRPDDLVYCDFETQSAVSLKKVGPKIYLEHQTTRLMSGVFMHGNTILLWVPKSRMPAFGNPLATVKAKIPNRMLQIATDEQPPELVQDWIRGGKVFAAHNAELFDAWLWEEKYGEEYGNPTWLDTIHLARAAGMPANLNGLLKAVLGIEKADNTAMMLLTEAKVNARGLVVYPVGTGPLWAKLAEYNIQDVVNLDAICEYLRQTGVADHEADICELHARINRRGFRVNTKYLHKLRQAWAVTQRDSRDEIARITGGKLSGQDINSGAKVKAWLADQGFVLPGNSLDRKVVDQVLQQPDKYLSSSDEATSILALLAERQNAVRSVVGKLDRVSEEVDSDECIRRCFVYHGAHPGRWSGRSVQPHNLPRGVKIKHPPRLDALVSERTLTLDQVKQCAKANNCSVSDVLSTLTRSIIQPRRGHKFIIFDYANIESRGIAFVAKCNTLLDAFARNEDVYCLMASKLFGRVITKADELERFIGKQIILGCGYQMWIERFALTCRVYGVDLQKAGVTPKDCVMSFRNAYKEIVQVWKAYEKAALGAVKHVGRVYVAGRCKFICENEQGIQWLKIVIPSGKTLRYRNARIVRIPNPYRTGDLMDQVEYTTQYGYSNSLYGGKIAENIVQSMSRGFLAHAMRETDSDTTPIVLHVHDEMVFEVPERKAEKLLHTLGSKISTAPPWARGFPLQVEGFVGDVYTKGALPGVKSHEFLDGKCIA